MDEQTTQAAAAERQIVEQAIHSLLELQGGAKDGALGYLRAAKHLQVLVGDEFTAAGREARVQGATWQEVSDVLGLAGRQSAERLFAPRRGERLAKAVEYAKQRVAPLEKQDLPGLGVIEFAHATGLSQSKVYWKIKKGELQTKTLENGRIRVLTPPEELG
jgi:hypothetical protein